MIEPSNLQPLRILIVEDNPLQAQTLRIGLRRLGYAVLGVAATADEAERLFRAEPPDLLLCDIHLATDEVADALPAPRDGIELAAALLATRRTPLIFLTSLVDEATFRRAQQVAPAAFLVKPFEADSLRRAIELAVLQGARVVEAANSALPPEPTRESAPAAPLPDVLFVRHTGRFDRLNLADILYLAADRSYCELHLVNGGKFALHTSLRDVEERLPTNRFVRIHRSYIVAWLAVETIDATVMEVRIRGGTRLPLGRTFRDALLQRLPQLD